MSQQVSPHIKMQLTLAKLGQAVGCDVWVPKADRTKSHNEHNLAKYSLGELPDLGLSQTVTSAIRNIDVLWLTANTLNAAFEIEHSTEIFSGILRLSDLIALVPNITFPIYIVAPQERKDEVAKQLMRQTFKALHLDKKCLYLSYEVLEENYDKIEFAEDPEKVRKIATTFGEIKKEPATLPVEKAPITSGKLEPTTRRSLRDYLRDRSDGSIALYEKLRKEIIRFGNDIVEGLSEKEGWIVYRRKEAKLAFCAIRPRKKLDKLTVSIPGPKDFSDPRGVTKKWGHGNYYWFDVYALNDTGYAAELIRQAYGLVTR
jgi:predicted transport protein